MGTSILCTVSEHATVPFRVLNPHPCPVVIRPDTTLGSIDFSENTGNLETVELIDSQFLDVSQTQNTWAPERNFDLSNSALNDDQKVQLNTLLNKYSDLFANHSFDLGRTHLASHNISVENALPVKQRPYRVSHVNKPKLQQHLQDMLQHNIIRQSQSPWSSPVIIIGKKDDGRRFVVDYRQLNSLTARSCEFCNFTVDHEPK